MDVDNGEEAVPDGGRREAVDRSAMAVSFDCFGTLVSLPRPPSPADDIADELGADVNELVHVGDNREADGGIDDHGDRYLQVDGDLRGLPDRLAAAGVVER